MAISHVNTQTGAPRTGGTPALTSTSVITKPTGLAIGDVMVALVHGNQSGFSAPSVRWTQLYSKPGASGSLYQVEIWYCVATSSETAASSFTFSAGDANAPLHAAISAYREVDQNNPINTSNFSSGTTANPQSTPNVTTTKNALVLHMRAVRHSSGTTTFSSTITNERWDAGNNGTVGYFSASYDSGSEAAAGTVTGQSLTASSGTNQTDTLTFAIALQSADVSAAAGLASATAAGKSATVGIGQSVSAGLATATAAAPAPSALAGKVVNTVGVAAATAAVPDVQRNARPSTAAASTTGKSPMLFFGTPGFRTKIVKPDTYPVEGLVGLSQRRITVSQD